MLITRTEVRQLPANTVYACTRTCRNSFGWC